MDRLLKMHRKIPYIRNNITEKEYRKTFYGNYTSLENKNYFY
jgi:hypothetical protein